MRQLSQTQRSNIMFWRQPEATILTCWETMKFTSAVVYALTITSVAAFAPSPVSVSRVSCPWVGLWRVRGG